MAEKNQRNLEMDYLSRRAQILQQFMDSVGESEELRSSLHLLCFLKCTDENQWAKIKEEFDKSLKKIAVGAHRAESEVDFFAAPLRRKEPLEGRRLRHAERRTDLQDRARDKRVLAGPRGPDEAQRADLRQVLRVDSRLIEQTRSLLIEFHNTCQSLSKVAETTAELHELHRKFNESVKTHKWESMQQVYSALNHTIDSWGALRFTQRRTSASRSTSCRPTSSELSATPSKSSSLSPR